MKIKVLVGLVAILLFFGLAGISSASLIQVTADSAISGELGWFAVDDAIFDTDTSLVASQFYDYSWSDPNSSISITPTDVPIDTGLTYFNFINSEWTVTGGSGDSLTDSLNNAVWIAGTSYVKFRGGTDYNDVSWSTTDYTGAPVPEPTTLILLGSGLAGLAFYRRKRK